MGKQVGRKVKKPLKITGKLTDSMFRALERAGYYPILTSRPTSGPK